MDRSESYWAGMMTWAGGNWPDAIAGAGEIFIDMLMCCCYIIFLFIEY